MLARDDQKCIDRLDRAGSERSPPAIEAAGDRNEAERHISPVIIAALHDAGLFRMLLPVSLGGGAADVVTFNQAIETIAAADGSTAWCLAQAVASTHAAGFLAPEIRARSFCRAPDGAVAWGPPGGVAKAVAADGGYVVTGRWRFASGSAHCPWLGGDLHGVRAATASRGSTSRADRSTAPMLFRKEAATIHDIWHVIGLRGTSSNEFEVQRSVRAGGLYDVARSAGGPARIRGPLLQHPDADALRHRFFRCGARPRARLSRRLHDARGDKESRAHTHGAPVPLREQSGHSGARRRGDLANCNRRALICTDMLREFWHAATANRAPVARTARAIARRHHRGDRAGAAASSISPIRAAGADAIFNGSAFERRFRDMHTANSAGSGASCPTSRAPAQALVRHRAEPAAVAMAGKRTEKPCARRTRRCCPGRGRYADDLPVAGRHLARPCHPLAARARRHRRASMPRRRWRTTASGRSSPARMFASCPIRSSPR